MSLDATLCLLLFRRSARDAFARAELPLPLGEADLLSTIDREQLERAARAACEGLLTRSHRGSGSLLEAFPRTIAAWDRANPGAGHYELAAAFAESRWFEPYRALPTCGGGPSLEESFFRFVEDAGVGDPATRKAECATAILRALVVSPEPSFRVPDFLRRAPKGYYAVLEPGPVLVAALGRSFVAGPITPLVADLLSAEGELETFARPATMSRESLQEARAELARLGLVAEVAV